MNKGMYEHPVSSHTTGNRLSILVCTPKLRSERTYRCLNALNDSTLGIEYDLIIMDNRGRADFSHAREMNKAIRIAEGPLLVLDDDVIVSGDWLRNMLVCLGPGVGAVSPSAAASSGQMRTRGCTFRRDGEAVLWRGNIDGPTCVPGTGSFCLLLNLPAWPAGLEFSLEYKKYFFDPDLLLRLWEHNLSTITTPDIIIHESGGTMREQHIDRAPLMAHDRQLFKRTWIDTGRLERLYEMYSHHWPAALRSIL